MSNDLLDCMSIPKESLYAPIAGDYVKYNATPNFGEIIGAKLWWKLVSKIDLAIIIIKREIWRLIKWF